MAQRRVHAVSISPRSVIMRSAACLCYRSLVAIVAVTWLFAALPGRLWAHSITTQQSAIATEPVVPHRMPVPGLPEFSRFPSDAEIIQARIFSLPLWPIEAAAVPGDDAAFAQENRALADALLAYAQATAPGDVSALTAFLERYPQSRWRAGLLAHLGRIYRHSGLFQHSIDAFEAAWALTRHGMDRHAQAIANWAVGELADLHTPMGHTARLQELLADLQGRKLSGPATEQWTAAVESLVRRQQQAGPQAACGIMALTHLLQRDSRDISPALLAAYASHDGMSLLQVNAVAQQSGLQLQMAKRQAGTPIPVPAVMHWQRGHYSAIVDRQERDQQAWYLVENPLAQETVWISQAVLDTETSGYFLIPAGDLPAGWQQASMLETADVWGKCWDGRQDQQQTSEYAEKILCQQHSRGIAVYNFHAMLVSLNIVDEPVGYTPPLGPPVTFRVTYNQREAFQPAIFPFANLGPKWTFAFLSYVTQFGGEVTVYLRGGGQERHTFGSPVTDPKSIGIHYQSQAELVGMQRSGLYFARFERRLPDGSKEIFAQSDGTPSGERRTFLTEIIDPAGNTVTLTYDAQLRVVAITDAIGQVTQIAYELPEEPLKITSVTDPFGRSAHFTYDAQGRLSTIEDVIGLTSTFTYDGDFISSLTTPYGTSRFRTGEVDNPTPSELRWLEATDPLGATERLETPFRLAANEPPVQATAYWDKHAWRQGSRDYSRARLLHWMVGYPGAHIMLSVPWREKPPLENEIVYTYAVCDACNTPDQLPPQAQGADGLPRTISRTLDDGSTQTYQFTYNERGYVTKTVDPAGRAFAFTYAEDGIDLLEMRHDTTQELLARFTYNTQHLPLTYTDAAGSSTTFTYNSHGQLRTVTNAQAESTTFAYNAQGYLITVTGPLPEAVTRFTYDDFGRVHTVTDAEGYQLTFAYDPLDRPTRITYPDGTFERIRYDRLDAVQFTDRQGRTTRVRYDALRRPVAITDALDRSTGLRWCDCGSLEQLIDPAGQVTTWKYDLQGRRIARVLADGTTTRYVYTPASGRLQRVIDAKDQVTTYTYTIDDNIRRLDFKNADVDTAPITFTYAAHYDRLVRMQDGIGTTRYTYHPIGVPGALQVVSVTGQLPDSRIDYAYDKLGRVVRRSINGVSAVMTYDALGRVSRLRNALGTFRLTYVGATERVQSVLYPNDQQTVLRYFGASGDQRLRQIRHQAPDGQVLSQFGYTYATTGEIHTLARYQPELQPARSTYAYRYDAASQLLAAALEDRNGAVLKTYAYDYEAAGNRQGEDVGASHRSASFNNVNQLVSLQHSGETQHFTYDANGNLLSDGERTFEWDARDRLTAVVSGNRRSEFSYDGFDRRVHLVETKSGVVVSDVWLLWCGADICEQRVLRQGSSRPQKRFFRFGETNGEHTYFYTRDHLGSIRQMTGKDGTVVASYDYDSYGRTVDRMGQTAASFGYADYYVHAPSHLSLTQYRAYDPALGRWLSCDPITEDGGLNLYRFVLNDPINLSDPQGLSPGAVQGYAVEKLKDYGVDQLKDYAVDKGLEGVKQKNPGVGQRLEEVKRLQDPLKEPRAYLIDRTLTRGRAQVTKCRPDVVRQADEAKRNIGITIDKAKQDFKNNPSTKPFFNTYQELEDASKEVGRRLGDYLKRLGID